ncbi:MAG: PAS domain-containing protein [Planctomycetes bacterium]|nr:PAS domain-containing protein [Planctomycetota bacterium]
MDTNYQPFDIAKANNLAKRSKEKLLQYFIGARFIIFIAVILRFLWHKDELLQVSQAINITFYVLLICLFLLYIFILIILSVTTKDSFCSDRSINVQVWIDSIFSLTFYFTTFKTTSDFFLFLALPVLISSLKVNFKIRGEIVKCTLISLGIIMVIQGIIFFDPESTNYINIDIILRIVSPRIVFVWGLFFISRFISNDRNQVFGVINQYIKASNEREAILNSIGEYVFAINEKHEIIWSNSKLKEEFPTKYGIKMEIGSKKHCYAKYLKSSVVCDECVSIQAIKKGERIERTKTWTLNGKSITFRITASPVKGEKGTIIGAVETLWDITEEEKWRKFKDEQSYLLKIIESSTDSIIVTNSKGHIEICNKGTLDLLGYSESTIKTMQSRDILCDQCGQKGDHIARNIMIELLKSTENRIFDYQTYFKTKRGILIPIGFTASIIRDENKKVIGLVGIGRDRRELERLQTEMLKKQRLSVIGSIAGKLAHYIKNKIGTLQLDTEYLRDSTMHYLNTGQEERFNKILRIIKQTIPRLKKF